MAPRRCSGPPDTQPAARGGASRGSGSRRRGPCASSAGTTRPPRSAGSAMRSASHRCRPTSSGRRSTRARSTLDRRPWAGSSLARSDVAARHARATTERCLRANVFATKALGSTSSARFVSSEPTISPRSQVPEALRPENVASQPTSSIGCLAPRPPEPTHPPSPTCARHPRVGPSTSLGPVTRSRPAIGPQSSSGRSTLTPSLAPVARVVGRRRRRAGAWANTSP